MNFRGHALAAFFISNFWFSQNGRVWASSLGPGWALVGWAKNEGLGKVWKSEIQGFGFSQGHKWKTATGDSFVWAWDAKNLGFD